MKYLLVSRMEDNLPQPQHTDIQWIVKCHVFEQPQKR